MTYLKSVCLYMSRRLTALFVVAIAGLPWSPMALAQQEGEQQEAEQPQGEMSADDTAKALANPAGSLANLANNLTYRTFKGDIPGADDQTAVTYTFQPVLPFPVGGKGSNHMPVQAS